MFFVFQIFSLLLIIDLKSLSDVNPNLLEPIYMIYGKL